MWKGIFKLSLSYIDEVQEFWIWIKLYFKNTDFDLHLIYFQRTCLDEDWDEKKKGQNCVLIIL